MLILISTACGDKAEKDIYSQFTHLHHHQWLKNAPCYFKPGITGDSLNISVAVRHESQYEYTHIGLTVDVVNADTVTLRRNVKLQVADSNGNWTSDGFGSLYQNSTLAIDNVRLDSTSVILLWQSMSCDTLHYISEVGIDITRKL